MLRSSRWSEASEADLSVAEAAEASLRARLTAVEHFLPLAALRAAENNEHIHQLRVATRRAIAALRLFRQLTARKAARRLQKSLRALRRAAGDARDLDVLIERQAAKAKHQKRVIERLRALRETAQQPVLEIHERLTARAKLANQVEAVLQGLRTKDWKDASFRSWASDRLHQAAEDFFDAAPQDSGDLEALHRFRIRGKRLRYELELLGPAFAAEFRKHCADVMTGLQDRLGNINDHVVAARHLEEWADAAENKKDRRDMKALLRREERQLQDSLTAFFAWWTPELMTELRETFQDGDS